MRLTAASLFVDDGMGANAAAGLAPTGDRAYLGALSQVDTNWTQGWTVGLDDSLWIAK